MGQPGLFFVYFRSFQTNIITIFTTNKCEKCPSRIWCQDLNPQPSECEPLPITTRPGLPPLFFCLSVSLCFLTTLYLVLPLFFSFHACMHLLHNVSSLSLSLSLCLSLFVSLSLCLYLFCPCFSKFYVSIKKPLKCEIAASSSKNYIQTNWRQNNRRLAYTKNDTGALQNIFAIFTPVLVANQQCDWCQFQWLRGYLNVAIVVILL